MNTLKKMAASLWRFPAHPVDSYEEFIEYGKFKGFIFIAIVLGPFVAFHNSEVWAERLGLASLQYGWVLAALIVGPFIITGVALCLAFFLNLFASLLKGQRNYGRFAFVILLSQFPVLFSTILAFLKFQFQIGGEAYEYSLMGQIYIMPESLKIIPLLFINLVIVALQIWGYVLYLRLYKHVSGLSSGNAFMASTLYPILIFLAILVGISNFGQ
ncbi:MAG: YIP1 family protein [Leptospirales bacterium]